MSSSSSRKRQKGDSEDKEESIEQRIAEAIKAALENASEANEAKRMNNRLTYVDMTKRMEQVGKLKSHSNWESFKETMNDIA